MTFAARRTVYNLYGRVFVLVMPLIGHIPSGPTFPLAIVWFIIGAFLLLAGEKRPQLTV